MDIRYCFWILSSKEDFTKKSLISASLFFFNFGQIVWWFYFSKSFLWLIKFWSSSKHSKLENYTLTRFYFVFIEKYHVFGLKIKVIPDLDTHCAILAQKLSRLPRLEVWQTTFQFLFFIQKKNIGKAKHGWFSAVAAGFFKIFFPPHSTSFWLLHALMNLRPELSIKVQLGAILHRDYCSENFRSILWFLIPPQIFWFCCFAFDHIDFTNFFWKIHEKFLSLF